MSYDFAQHLRRNTRALKSRLVTDTLNDKFFDQLPDPDPVLRKLGKTHDVYDQIFTDSHVLGEIRAQRAGLLNYEWQVMPGADDPASQRAAELCSDYLKQLSLTGNLTTLDDINWSVYSAVYYGRRHHELVWDVIDGVLLPVEFVALKADKLVYTKNGLRLRRSPTDLVDIPPYKLITSRHMPSDGNPYGVAVFSACFWPYLFKRGGLKYFNRFCEKFGIPWAIGKYTPGTSEADQDKLLDMLSNMISDGVAAIPDDGTIDLITAKASGEPAQEGLIKRCNLELSKAITSQTLATEINGSGSRAAAETHADRENNVAAADRKMVENFWNTVFRMITEKNVLNATPPTYQFYEESQPRKQWLEFFDGADKHVDIDPAFKYDKLQIPQPVNSGKKQFSAHTCPDCNLSFSANTDDLTDAVDNAGQTIINDMAKPIRDLLDSVDTLDEFRDGLLKLYPSIDHDRLGELLQQAMELSFLHGMDTERD